MTAWAGSGLTAGEVSQALDQHQVIVGFGDSSSVGIGGLTLGGMMMVVGAFNQVQGSLRWFVDPETGRPLCIDEWESVGPASGMFVSKFGGFVDPNCLMIDKLACEPALRLWSRPVSEDMKDRAWGMSADRNVCSHLVRQHSVGWTRRATTFYVLDPASPLFPERSARIQHRLKAGADRRPASAGG